MKKILPNWYQHGILVDNYPSLMTQTTKTICWGIPKKKAFKINKVNFDPENCEKKDKKWDLNQIVINFGLSSLVYWSIQVKILNPNFD